MTKKIISNLYFSYNGISKEVSSGGKIKRIEMGGYGITGKINNQEISLKNNQRVVINLDAKHNNVVTLILKSTLTLNTYCIIEKEILIEENQISRIEISNFRDLK